MTTGTYVSQNHGSHVVYSFRDCTGTMMQLSALGDPETWKFSMDDKYFKKQSADVVWLVPIRILLFILFALLGIKVGRCEPLGLLRVGMLERSPRTAARRAPVARKELHGPATRQSRRTTCRFRCSIPSPSESRPRRRKAETRPSLALEIRRTG